MVDYEKQHMKCRYCNAEIEEYLWNLGSAPLLNVCLTPEKRVQKLALINYKI